MNIYIECFIMIPFFVVSLQFYSWIVSLEGLEKQRHCRSLGIAYTTAGTLCLILRSLPFAVIGLIFFMLGLRLLAHGLDRINKTRFIDSYQDPDQVNRYRVNKTIASERLQEPGQVPSSACNEIES